MFINFDPFNGMGKAVTYSLDIHIGNHVETQTFSQPAPFATMQAIQLCQELLQDPRPVKAVWKKQTYVEKRPENDKYITESVEFYNATWIKEFGDENNG